MREAAAEFFHQMYGMRSQRMTYFRTDFLDYLLMLLLTALVLFLAYGIYSPMALAGAALCVAMGILFPLRHGAAIRTPLLFRRPQDVLYLFVYKVRNLQPVWLFAVGALVLQSYLITLTPGLPHRTELMRTAALWLFYAHFGGILLYRTLILIAHLRRAELVREVLEQTAWKAAIARQPAVGLQIVHAYFTGVLTHMVLIAPWYVIICMCDFSLVFMPAMVAINIWTQLRFFNVFNQWFYRDHWLGHNSELEFLYLHGPHHDAIPSGLIGVAGNGFLEGALRHTLGYVTPFFEPVMAAALYTFEIKRDIELQQYIPGIYPEMPRVLQEVTQHSMHHMGQLEPYGIGLKFDQPQIPDNLRKGTRLPPEILDSIRLDEELTGYKWDTPRYRRYLALVDKYRTDRTEPEAATLEGAGKAGTTRMQRLGERDGN